MTMKYMAIIDADEKPVSCEFIGCNGNVAPYLIGATTNIKALEQGPEDAISRKAVLACKQTFTDNAGYETEYVDIEDIEALPPVNTLDKIRTEIMDTGAYEQEVNGKTEFLKGINYCLGVIDKCKADKEIYNLMDSIDNIDVVKLTDEEQRIFLAAMSRELKICREEDRNPGDVKILVAICNNIERKVKNELF